MTTTGLCNEPVYLIKKGRIVYKMKCCISVLKRNIVRSSDNYIIFICKNLITNEKVRPQGLRIIRAVFRRFKVWPKLDARHCGTIDMILQFGPWPSAYSSGSYLQEIPSNNSWANICFINGIGVFGFFIITYCWCYAGGNCHDVSRTDPAVNRALSLYVEYNITSPHIRDCCILLG